MKNLTVAWVALHEASHCFVDHEQGAASGAVVFSDDAGDVIGGMAGRDDLIGAPATPYAVGQPRKYTLDGLDFRALLDMAVLHAAGFTGDAIHRDPSNRDGVVVQEHDRQTVRACAKAALGDGADGAELDCFVALAVQIAWTMLSRNWFIVQKLAAELEQRRRLTGAQVAQIIQEARAQSRQAELA